MGRSQRMHNNNNTALLHQGHILHHHTTGRRTPPPPPPPHIAKQEGKLSAYVTLVSTSNVDDSKLIYSCIQSFLSCRTFAAAAAVLSAEPPRRGHT